MWNVDTGECLRVLRGHQQQLYSVTFDGVRVATGSLDSTVRLWDAETGCALLQYDRPVTGLVLTNYISYPLVNASPSCRAIRHLWAMCSLLMTIWSPEGPMGV